MFNCANSANLKQLKKFLVSNGTVRGLWRTRARSFQATRSPRWNYCSGTIKSFCALCEEQKAAPETSQNHVIPDFKPHILGAEGTNSSRDDSSTPERHTTANGDSSPSTAPSPQIYLATGIFYVAYIYKMQPV